MEKCYGFLNALNSAFRHTHKITLLDNVLDILGIYVNQKAYILR